MVGAYSAEYDFGFVYTQPYVANEAHGRRNKVVGVPGIEIQPVNGNGQVGATTAISCPAPNGCTACGTIFDCLGHSRAFVDSQP